MRKTVSNILLSTVVYELREFLLMWQLRLERWMKKRRGCRCWSRSVPHTAGAPRAGSRGEAARRVLGAAAAAEAGSSRRTASLSGDRAPAAKAWSPTRAWSSPAHWEVQTEEKRWWSHDLWRKKRKWMMTLMTTYVTSQWRCCAGAHRRYLVRHRALFPWREARVPLSWTVRRRWREQQSGARSLRPQDPQGCPSTPGRRPWSLSPLCSRHPGHHLSRCCRHLHQRNEYISSFSCDIKRLP